MADGILPHPKFGVPGPRATKGSKRKPSKFDHHMDVLRSVPGQWGMVSEYSKGGPKATYELARGDVRYLFALIKRRYPLEQWKISSRTVEGTWNHRQVWLSYIGPKTQEEEDERRRLALARHQQNKEKAQAKRAAKALKARQQAEQLQRENRAREGSER